MDDLISRQAANDAALEFFVEFLGGAFHEDDQKILMKRMNELPSAQPEHSAWVNSKDGYSGHVKCKACFKTYDWDSEAQYFNFCPNCGADMRGEQDG